MQESAIRRMGTHPRAEPGHHLVCAWLSGPGDIPVGRFPGHLARPARRFARRARCSTAHPRFPAAARDDCRHHAGPWRCVRPSIGLLVTTGSQQGLDLSRACCSIPATSSWSNCLATLARSPRSATSAPRWTAFRRRRTESTWRRSTRIRRAARRRRPARAFPVRRRRISRIRPAC